MARKSYHPPKDIDASVMEYHLGKILQAQATHDAAKAAAKRAADLVKAAKKNCADVGLDVELMLQCEAERRMTPEDRRARDEAAELRAELRETYIEALGDTPVEQFIKAANEKDERDRREHLEKQQSARDAEAVRGRRISGLTEGMERALRGVEDPDKPEPPDETDVTEGDGEEPDAAGEGEGDLGQPPPTDRGRLAEGDGAPA